MNLAKVSTFERNSVEVLSRQYSSKGWTTAIVASGDDWDTCTLWYRVRAHSGLVYDARLQKYSNFLRKRWVIMLGVGDGDLSQSPTKFLGYSHANSLLKAYQEVERLMSGARAPYLELEDVLKEIGVAASLERRTAHGLDTFSE